MVQSTRGRLSIFGRLTTVIPSCGTAIPIIPRPDRMDRQSRSLSSVWPALSYQDWATTASALHLWSQVVGKIRMVQTPWTNHSWHVPLYLSARGLTTSPIPYGGTLFELIFEFLDQELVIQSGAGDRRVVPLRSRSVTEFYGR